MIITHKITMDLQEPGNMPRIHAVQDDQYSRNLEITLSSDGKSWVVPEDAAVLIRYRKPDGTGGEYNTLPDGSTAWTADGHILTIALAPQALTVPGMVMLSVSLISGETQLTTFAVCLNVKPAVCSLITESADYVNIMTVGSVNVLEAGKEPTATITGTIENPVLHLGLPLGDGTSVAGKDISVEEKENGYWDLTDYWVDAEGIYVKRTNLIPVKLGEGFLYTGNGADNVPSVMWYDAAGNVKFYEQYQAENGVRVITVPKGVSYVRFYSHSYTGVDMVLLGIIYLPAGDDRRIVIDSVTGEYWGLQNNIVISSVETSGAKRTNPILVSQGDTFYYYGYGRWDTPSVIWFDADGEILAYEQHCDEANNQPIAVILTPPVGAAFARFYSYNQFGEAPLGLAYSTANERIDYVVARDVLYGKKYVACGDSFTAGDFTHAENPAQAWDNILGTYKTYPWWIAERNRMVLVNEAICGTTMYNNGAENAFSVSRYTQIPKDADYITLCFGLNETNAELGTLADTTNDTVIGAWNVVLEYLITNMPYAKIGIIIPDSWCTQAMRDAIVSVAEYWGIPYLDLKGDPKVPLMIGGRYSYTTVSGKAIALRNAAFQVTDADSHPNLKGHEYRSTVIENFMRSL